MAVAADTLERLAYAALAEDVGEGDVTTEAVVDADASGSAVIFLKEPGVVCGLGIVETVFRALDEEVEVEALVEEGSLVESRTAVVRLSGPLRAILTGERTALNFLGRLSGIATLTRAYVEAVAGTRAVILDTRKTTPGLRRLEKRAVADGGGVNHRAGLYDAILIKENHSAAAGGVAEAVRRAREARPDLPLAVEVRDAAEIDAALEAGAPRLLLDNMTPDQIRAAVARVAGRAELEASGGVDERTVLVYATIEGLHYVSMGALTHSAPGLDLSMALEALPRT
jgi:nicotinate-nucleotide pyrophosphorylase (carboxylating)